MPGPGEGGGRPKKAAAPPVVEVCQVVMSKQMRRSWRWPDKEDWTRPKELNVPSSRK